MITAFLSAKGGAGQTAALVNIAAATASDLSRKVLICDLNVGRGAVEYPFGAEDQAVWNIVDIFEAGCKIGDALLRIPEYGELYLLSASRSRNLSAVTKSSLARLLKLLSGAFDDIFLDVPAASLTAADLAIHSADRLVLVSGTDKVSVTLSRNYLQEIPEELRDMPLLLTRVRLDLVKEELAAGPEEVSEKLGLKILGIIPENDEIFLQSETHEDIIHMKTQALRSFINIARRLQGENIPIDLRKA
jgi:septum site-determining protein MinD